MESIPVVGRSFGQNALMWGVGILLVLGGCSSNPEPQPEPSKKEIRQDSDRFFNKMGKEENKSATTP